ncbi:MAG: type II toxin-antitoxin system HicB family antitoxin [Syntrophomonas sp.]|jgi:predicted RNase H-like HicB family nuclease|nr:type II toxin-antitoxin system HicB family antitoxin [Syntrophomonas sp.]
MKYIYPAVFTQEDGIYNVKVPNLPGCFTCGDTLIDAIEMARDAIAMWICDCEDKNESIPLASNPKEIICEPGCLVNLIDIDTIEYRRENDNHSIKKTLTIPNWLNVKAEKAEINFSQTLQKALKQQLGIL